MIKSQKHILNLVLMFILAFCAVLLFAACNNNPDPTPEDPEEPQPIMHTVTINLGILDPELIDVPSSFVVEDGTTITLSSSEIELIQQNTPEEYSFEEIRINDQNGDIFSSLVVEEDVTLFVVFSVKTYSVTFIYDNMLVESSVKYAFGDEVLIEDIMKNTTLDEFEEEKTGLYFVGWSTNYCELFNFNAYTRHDEQSNEDNEDIEPDYPDYSETHMTAQEYVGNYLNTHKTISSIKIGKSNNLYAVYAPEKYNGITVEGCEQTSFYFGEPLPNAEYGYTYEGAPITHCPDLGDNEENVNATFEKFVPVEGTTIFYIIVDEERYDFLSINTLTDVSSPIEVNPDFNLNIGHVYVNGTPLAINVTGRVSVLSIDDPTDDELDDEDDEEEPIDVPNPALNGPTNQVWKILSDVENFTKNGIWIHGDDEIELTYTLN